MKEFICDNGTRKLQPKEIKTEGISGKIKSFINSYFNKKEIYSTLYKDGSYTMRMPYKKANEFAKKFNGKVVCIEGVKGFYHEI